MKRMEQCCPFVTVWRADGAKMNIRMWTQMKVIAQNITKSLLGSIQHSTAITNNSIAAPRFYAASFPSDQINLWADTAWNAVKACSISNNKESHNNIFWFDVPVLPPSGLSPLYTVLVSSPSSSLSSASASFMVSGSCTAPARIFSTNAPHSLFYHKPCSRSEPRGEKKKNDKQQGG